ncbi:peroxiredoxin [Crucibulum laeve]|uniref:Putative peroxiredoxin n=1 Tax=Crucibulum laeve TaxID=68775 RepID=A0A5C3LTV8_9AGAR|nr:peroxiredoxin [Crucibulum laeve]
MSLKVGDTIPEGTFLTIPYTPALEDKVSTKLSTNEWKGKKVVLFSVPGAFTPTCHANHLPPYIQKYDEFKAKGIDVVAVVAANDVFVLSGWGRFEGLTDKIITLSDGDAKWSKSIGLEKDLTALGLGIRTGRYALVLDDLVVKYLGVEPGRDVTVSGAEAVLAAL